MGENVRDTRRSTTSGVVAGLVLGFGVACSAQAAVITLTDCANDPHIAAAGQVTQVDVGTDDLVIACALASRLGTGALLVAAHDVTVQGSGGTLTSATRLCITVAATGKFVAVDTSLVASNGNGSMLITAHDGMRFDRTMVTVGPLTDRGDQLTLTCLDGGRNGCGIVARSSSFKSRLVNISATGDVRFANVRVHTTSPCDRIFIVSTQGNVDLNGCGNSILSDVEGALTITAAGFVDLSFAKVLVAEDITITSGSAPGSASGGRTSG